MTDSMYEVAESVLTKGASLIKGDISIYNNKLKDQAMRLNDLTLVKICTFENDATWTMTSSLVDMTGANIVVKVPIYEDEKIVEALFYIGLSREWQKVWTIVNNTKMSLQSTIISHVKNQIK